MGSDYIGEGGRGKREIIIGRGRYRIKIGLGVVGLERGRGEGRGGRERGREDSPRRGRPFWTKLLVPLCPL